ncbi:divalent metal cation transporter [Actinoallomurus sp. NPDC052274]|uniref:divalent metal cation transporter n=1 Tax=Actinoallomurus sp. NPDC052274 TaxID=3155420 RepID=UPI00343D9AE5
MTCSASTTPCTAVKGAKGFYSVYALLIVFAAVISLTASDKVLGLITQGVQVLAGVLLPSATVFLLLLCNDRAVLGPWTNGRRTNAFTSAVVGVLVTLSTILTASVLFPTITADQILDIVGAGGVGGLLAIGYAVLRRRAATPAEPIDRIGKDTWRMPPQAELPKPFFSTGRKIGMAALRLYLVAAVVLVIIKITQLALGH